MMELNDKYKERFFSRIRKTEGCWLWTGGTTRFGYGIFPTYSNKKLFNHYTHRLSYQLHKGEIPKGMCVCHSCDNPPCVNPEHLWLGTIKDNNDDMHKKKRVTYLRGQDSQNAILTWEQVREIRKLFREGETRVNLSAKYGTAYNNIRNIVNNKTWKEDLIENKS